MKLLPSLFILAASFLHATQASSRELVIAVSPYMDTAAAKGQSIEVLKFLTEQEPGDTAIILDGYNLTLLGEWNTPENPAYKSPKARLAVNRSAVAALLRFSGSATPPGGAGKPTVTGALRLPHLLRYIAANFPSADRQDVVILGSPLYEDLDTPALSMTQERFPGDGHLFSAPSTTPYGASGNSELLTNMWIHIGYGDNGMTGSDRHDEYILRYWTLFIEQQGGTLSSFVGNLPTLFRGIKRNAAPLKHDFSPERSDKLEMIRLAPVEVKESIFERPVTAAPLPAAKARRAERVQVGLSWDCACDLDLYAQAYPGATLLYYAQTTSPQGRYWKDYTHSPKSSNGQEVIAFGVPLDLRSLRLAVNVYSGSAPDGIEGEIRISIDGATYARAFRLEATTGNGGAGMPQMMQTGYTNNDQTVFINPLQVVGVQ